MAYPGTEQSLLRMRLSDHVDLGAEYPHQLLSTEGAPDVGDPYKPVSEAGRDQAEGDAEIS